MALQHHDPNKQRRWLDLIRQWQNSKLSVRAFCLKHRLAEPSFYSWRRCLRQRGFLDEDPVQAAPPMPAAFVQVLLDAQPATPIEVVLASGRRLVVRPGFDAASLRQLLRVLEEPPC